VTGDRGGWRARQRQRHRLTRRVVREGVDGSLPVTYGAGLIDGRTLRVTVTEVATLSGIEGFGAGLYRSALLSKHLCWVGLDQVMVERGQPRSGHSRRAPGNNIPVQRYDRRFW
jgi:hypothetical protein